MSTILDTDLLLLNRGSTSYTCTAAQFRDNPSSIIQSTDYFLVNTGGNPRKITYANLGSTTNLQDTDKFLVQRGADTFTVTWDIFQDDLGLGQPTGTITSNIPSSYSSTSGANTAFTFEVETTGSPTESYQWYWSGTPVPNGTQKTFGINPFYTNDTGKTLQCRLTLSKSGYDDIVINSNTMSLSISKSTAGGRFETPSDSEPYQENAAYDNPQNWKRVNSDKESGDINTGSWKRAYEHLSTDRKHASFRCFVRRNASHQRNHFKKRDYTKGRNNNDVCGNDRWDNGRGYNAAGKMAWYAQTKPGNEYPQNMPSGASYNNGPRLDWNRGPVSNGTVGDSTSLHIDLNPDDWRYRDLGRYSNMEWFCNLSDVATGNSIENAKEYEWGSATQLEQRHFYTWKDRPQGGNPQRLNGGCGQPDDYNWGKAKLSDSDRIGYRGLPYDYAYQERSGIPPQRSSESDFFNDDRWYKSSLSSAENSARKLDADKNGLLVTFENNQFLFNGNTIDQVEFRVGQKYTFFFPNRPTANIRFNDVADETDKVEDASVGTMIGFQPLPDMVGTQQLRIVEGTRNKLVNFTILDALVRDLTDVAYECSGYYPLYDSKAAADNASSSGTSTEYNLEGYSHYMPDGLTFGVDMFLGNYTGGTEVL